MSQEITIEVSPREKLGSGGSFKIRSSGNIPGIVYGPTRKTPTPVTVESSQLLSTYKKSGRTTLITLKSTDKNLDGVKVRIADVQVHPLKNKVLHFDMHELDLKRPTRSTVPLRFVGKAKGVANGGILSIMTRELEVKSLPLDTPPFIEVDVTDLDVGNSIHVSELSDKIKDKKFEFVFTNDIALATIALPEEEVKATEAAATPAEGAPAAAAGAPAAGAPAAAAAKAPAAPAKK